MKFKEILQKCEAEVQAMGIEIDYTIAGFGIKEWITDLTAKHANLDRKMEEQRLSAFKAELHDMLSSDTKAEIKLKKIAEKI